MDAREFEFEKLDAFGVSLQIARVIDRLSGSLPTGRGYMRDQLRRAANSVVLNVAEGAGEFSRREKGRFYRMAKRSATEVAAQVMLIESLALLEPEVCEEALDLLHREVSMLSGLSQWAAEVEASRGVREQMPEDE